MPKTIKESTLHFDKSRQKPYLKLERKQSFLPPNLQIFKQKLLLGDGFIT